MQLKYYLRLLLSEVAYRVYLLGVERKQVYDAIRDLKFDLAEGNLHRTGYVDHYSGANELQVWRRYKAGFDSGARNEIRYRAEYVRDRLLELPIRSYVNFGCSYGWLEGELAGRLTAYGVDRNARAIERNRAQFPKAHFFAGDIFEFLGAHAVDALVHVNIGVYFLPAFIRKLYAAARDAGARYIVAWEPSGISRQTNRYFDYSTEPRQTVVFRGPMLLNNYPNLMAEAGYALVHSAILKPPNPYGDFRAACFIGRRET